MENQNMEPSLPLDIAERTGYTNWQIFRSQGGMAHIYRATKIATGQEVIIKVMRASEDAQRYEQFRHRFKQERLIASLLRNSADEHLLPAIDHGEFLQDASGRATYYLVTPYIKGGSLNDLLQKEKPWQTWALPQIVDVIEQGAKGLSHLHERKIVHQDVKPSNLLWELGLVQLAQRRIHIWLMDFGAADLESAEASKRVIGTLPYMSPEQRKGFIRCSTDQYALALIARFLLTGYPPSLREIDLYTPLVQLNQSLTKQISEIVLKALARDPEQRFASVLEFAEALKMAMPQTIPLIPPSPLAEQPDFYAASTEQRSSLQPHAMQDTPLLKPPIIRPEPYKPVSDSLQVFPIEQMPARKNISSEPSLPLFPSQGLLDVPLPDSPTRLAWSPDGKRLDCTFYRNAPLVVSMDRRTEILNSLAYGHTACWAPDGRFIAVSIRHPDDQPPAEIRFWDRTTSREHPLSLPFPNKAPIFGMDWSRDGYLAIWLENELRIYDFSNFVAQKQPPVPYTVDIGNMRSNKLTTLRWSPDGEWLAAGESNGQVLCWQRRTRITQKRLLDTGNVYSMDWSPDGQILVAAYAINRIWFWNLQTGETAVWKIEYPEGLRIISVSPQTAHLVVATQSRLILGRVGDRVPSARHPGRLQVAWSSDRKLATLDEEERRLLIWQT